MDELKGKVLFVGDGDFSFSVAYATKHQSKDEMQMFTSTLLSAEEIVQLHARAQENIDTLTKLGVKIFYKVDATKLSANDQLLSLKFDAVLFNFPHTGGKSNIKRNRQLLKDFFGSVESVLVPGGHVIVTLCRGQGGTPRDHPVREWHDSWQVVGQAAYSSWVMHDIDNFDIERYPQYSSTGFKSMDRNFYTKDSFSYFFRKVPEIKVKPFEAINVKTFRLPAYIVRKIVICKRLHGKSSHPLSVIRTKLQHTLQEVFGLDRENHLVMDSSCSTSDIELVNPSISQSVTSANCDSISNVAASPRDMNTIELNLGKGFTECSDFEHIEHINGEMKNKARPDILIPQQKPLDLEAWTPRFYVGDCVQEDISSVHNITSLRTSMLESSLFKKYCSNDQLVYKSVLISGQVFRRRFLNSFVHPHALGHEMILVAPIPAGETGAEESQRMFSSQIMSVFQNILPQHGNTVICDEADDKLPVYHRPFLQNAFSLSYEYCSSNAFTLAACNQVESRGPPDPNRAKVWKQKLIERKVAYCGILNTTSVTEHNQTPCSASYCAIFDLDALALSCYDIPDYRLLWSEDPLLMEQFEDTRHADGLCLYRPLSLHPPLWRHDISFWEPAHASVDEVKLVDLVTSMAGEAVCEVLLMNVWRDPDTRLMSKCYRLGYQSPDQALSHAAAHALQNEVRLQVERSLGVTLR